MTLTATLMLEAYDALDDGHHLVPVSELRRCCGSEDRAEQDAAIRELRMAGILGLSPADGRVPVSEAVKAGGVREDGANLVYSSRKAR